MKRVKGIGMKRNLNGTLTITANLLSGLLAVLGAEKVSRMNTTNWLDVLQDALEEIDVEAYLNDHDPDWFDHYKCDKWIAFEMMTADASHDEMRAIIARYGNG